MRLTIKCGVKCKKCKATEWQVFHGYNKCKCGTALWVIRLVEDGATRFRFEQGTLPTDYRGWMAVTV